MLTAGAAACGGAVVPPAPPFKKLSEKRVSLWRPARPFCEKCVTLIGRDTLEGERGVSRLEMVRRSTLLGGEVRVVVVMVGELSTSIS